MFSLLKIRGTIIGLILVGILSMSSCTVYRTLRYGGLPSQNDYKRFPQQKVLNGDTPFYFKKASTDYKLGTSIGLTNRDFNSTNVSLDSLVQLHNTLYFLIIRNDTILYSYFKDTYTDRSLMSSFSMVKPMISTMIGIAITEGKLSLTSDNAKFYWGNNLRKEVSKAELEFPPDTQFKYSSTNTQLLGMIIARATGLKLSNYLQEKIWKPLGMEAPAYWSLDRKDEKAIEKAFCCFQARTTDFAKFGRLYLNEGKWNEKQIVPKQWIIDSTRPDPRGNNKHYYNNNWGLGLMKYGSYFAVGLYGQFLYFYPEKNIMIVRFGNTDTSYHPNYWKETFLQIIDQLESNIDQNNFFRIYLDYRVIFMILISKK